MVGKKLNMHPVPLEELVQQCGVTLAVIDYAIWYLETKPLQSISAKISVKKPNLYRQYFLHYLFFIIYILIG